MLRSTPNIRRWTDRSAVDGQADPSPNFWKWRERNVCPWESTRKKKFCDLGLCENDIKAPNLHSQPRRLNPEKVH